MLVKKIFLFISLLLLIECNGSIKNNIKKTNYINKQRIVNNNRYQFSLYYFDKYNSATNFYESYQQQLINCQQLINEANEKLKQVKNNELIDSRLTKADHRDLFVFFNSLKNIMIRKQQWLINEHLGNGYWLISIVKIFFDLMMYFIIFMFFEKKNIEIKKNIILSSFHYILIIYSILNFFFNCLTPFWYYLINNIHYLFIKNNFDLDEMIINIYKTTIIRLNYQFHLLFKNTFFHICSKKFGSVFLKANYFYYYHSAKMINFCVEDSSYDITYVIPFLFTNNCNLATNIFDFIINLSNLFITIWIVRLFFIRNVENFIINFFIRSFIFLLLLIELATIINIIFIHIFNKKNYFNQFYIMITNHFKSLPFVNKYYCIQKNYFQKKYSSLINILLIILFSIVMILIANLITLISIYI